jgi:hypothetical protein
MIKNKSILVFIFLLIASALPALLGFVLSSDKVIYSGVVFNPVDGYSYLAKMEIGNAGDWLFRLPYTPDAGEGRWLYPFYIAAGQVLRTIRLSLPVGFNVLRIFSYGCLVFSLIKLAQCVFTNQPSNQPLNILLMAAGGGLGWILLPFGKFGADFWISEAYPFLAGLANPHFPLALAIMVLSVLIVDQEYSGLRLAGTGLLAITLSVLSPFGFVLMSAILVAGWIWEKKDGLKTSLKPVLIFLVTGLPYCIYQYWAVGSTPQLAAWTAQNKTPSPEIWDVVLSFSPWIILMVTGGNYLYQQRENPIIRRLILWVVFAFILTVIPFNLQRRFMIGLYIPFSCLGLLVLPSVAEKVKVTHKKLLIFCTALAIPTTILLIIMVSVSIGTRASLYFSDRDELAAIQWLTQQGDGKSLVLASDQTGMVIPSVSRLQVLYGHPFETVDAEKQKKGVIDFFSGNQNLVDSKSYLEKMKVNWIFYGPREKALGSPVILKNIIPIQQFGIVQIFNITEIID